MPTARIASAKAAIRASQEAGASQAPQARLHLRLAEEQFDRARILVRDDENERAAHVLARAEADAELARAIAREEAARTQSERVSLRLREMQGAPRPGGR